MYKDVSDFEKSLLIKGLFLEMLYLNTGQKEDTLKEKYKNRILRQDDNITELSQYKLAKSTSALVDKLEEEKEDHSVLCEWRRTGEWYSVCHEEIFLRRRKDYKIIFSVSLPWD